MKGSVRTKLILAFILAVLILGGVFCWRHARHETAGMSVDWTATGKPLQVDGVILDDKGKPAADREVVVWSDSGSQSTTTDAVGRFTVKLGEQDVRALEVDGVGKIEWGTLGVDCTNGLDFRITLKPGTLASSGHGGH